MKLIIEMNLDNAEFECDPATAAGAILIRLAEDWMALGFGNTGQETEDGANGIIADTNGNTIGGWTVAGIIEELPQEKPQAKTFEERLSDRLTPGNIPPDPEGENDNRAGWAQTAVDAFQNATGTEPEDVICDLTCDLRHWADRNGQNWERELTRGMNHYDEETLED